MRSPKDLSIRVKLFMAVLMPLAGFIYFGGQYILENYQLQQQMEGLKSLTQLSGANSALVHELQKERGASAGFLGSKGTKFADVLSKQRQLTDQANKALDEFIAITPLPTDIQSSLTKIKQQLAERSAIRQRIDRQDISVGEAVAYYTSLNGRLLSVIDLIAQNTTEASLARDAVAFSAFLQYKERAGIERAVLSGTFGNDAFAPGFYARFITLLAEQKAFEHSFRSTATQESIAFLDKTLTGSAVDEVERMRNIAKEKAATGGFGIDPTYWFEQKTQRINLLKRVDDHLSQGLLAHNDELSTAAQGSLYSSLLLVTVPLLLTLLLSVLITRLLDRELQAIGKAVQKVSGSYDLTTHADVLAHDEVGALSESFNDLVDQFHEIISEVNQACSLISAASREAATISDSVISDVTTGSQQAEMVATAMSEMSSTVAEITRNAVEAAQATQVANEQAQHGNSEVETTVSMITRLASEIEQATAVVRELQTNSDQVSRFIAIIDAISEKTNLLALNAAIEAARAGETGRGFAVVADEVRALSIQTKESTKEISSMVEHLQNGSQNAVTAMERGMKMAQDTVQEVEAAGKDLHKIVTSAEALMQMNDQVATASEEQSAVAEEINRNIVQIRDIYDHTNGLTSSLHESSANLAELSTKLQELVKRFRLSA